MKDMELLTEKDLEYFRKEEEEGRAVILEISEQQLLHLDFSQWLNRKPDEIRKEEVLEWLQKNRNEFQDIYDREKKNDGNIRPKQFDGVMYRTLAEWLQEHEISEEQYEVIRQAVQRYFTEEQILELLQMEEEQERKRY